MWLYGHVNAAYAYSFHWFSIFALFIVGYAFLFLKFGASSRIAILLSFGLYFTGYSQFWWNEKGSEFAIFPWTLIPFFLNIRFAYKLAIFYYATVFWLLTNFYPPVQISLAFVGLVLLLATQPKLFRLPQLPLVALVAGLAAGTTALYLYDYLIATSTTLYPGGRNVTGGGLPPFFITSWFLPAINFSWSYVSLVPLNMSEIGTVGMYYYMSVLVFLNYGNFPTQWKNIAFRKVFSLLAIGFLMQVAWMTLPIPAAVGKILLWNNVQPSRMQFASGVTLTFLAFYVAHVLGVVFSIRRLIVLSLGVGILWFLNKPLPGWKPALDLLIIPILAGAYLILRTRKNLHHEGILISSVLFSLLLFGRFNPLQSAWPIFNSPPSEAIQYFKKLEQANNGVLATYGIPGAVANGAGFRSLSHVTAVPSMDFWTKSFPEIPSDELNSVFNRYSHIMPDVVARPRLLQADAVIAPVSRFTKPSDAALVDQYPVDAYKLGHFGVEKLPDMLLVNGWGGWKHAVEFHAFEIKAYPKIAGKVEFIPVVRGDLPLNTNHQVSMLNGFRMAIPWQGTAMPTCLTLIAFDKFSGERLMLQNPPEIPACRPDAGE